MSEVVNAAVVKLSEKIDSFDSTAKFVIKDEGAILIDETGVRAATDTDEAEVTLTASRETFEGILNGDVNPTTAFMMGKLTVDGSMGVAMQLGQKLS
ncbi:MAG: SCP2 sterol-binding domain-containing protein [Paracoccus sp. (in: a-proteobacteria)]|uniref:SCP2 sterol-binding domain-containing protein n=1 Tax=Paracoccus sp. TaxID=267 RepID=UPI00391B5036